MNFRTIIDRWPSIDQMAADLSVKPDTVRKWRERDSVPGEYWAAIVRAARDRRLAVRLEDLAAAASRGLAAKAG